MGFDYLRPPIGETLFNKQGIINEVWNKFFNELIGVEQFKQLEGIVANHVLVGYDISSTDYVAGTSGWRIASDSGSGVAEFNIPIISYEQLTGTIAAAVGGVGAAGLTGETSGDTAVRFWAGSTFANRASAPFRVLQNGVTYMTGAVIDSTSTINGSAASGVLFTGQADLTATIINGGIVTTGTIEVAQGGTVAAGITGNTSGDTAVRFWSGSTFTNRATAPFRVLQNGTVYMTGAVIDSTSTINGIASSTVVSGAAAGATANQSSTATILSGNHTGTVQGYTIITGGYISTGILTASNIQTGTLNCNSISLSGNISSAVSGSYYNLTNGNMYFATSGYIYFGGATSYGSIWGNASQLRLSYSSSYPNIGLVSGKIELETASGTKIHFNAGTFGPVTDGSVSLGASGADFNSLYVQAVYLNGTQIHDTYDDLDVLHGIKALPNGKMDLLSLPKQFTSFDKAKEKLKKDNGNMLSDKEIEKSLSNYNDMAHLIKVNLGEFINLVEGAVRQLDKETSGIHYEMLDWFNDIDKRLNKIEKEKSNA